jgi:hypothetical protein
MSTRNVLLVFIIIILFILICRDNEEEEYSLVSNFKNKLPALYQYTKNREYIKSKAFVTMKDQIGTTTDVRKLCINFKRYKDEKMDQVSAGDPFPRFVSPIDNSSTAQQAVLENINTFCSAFDFIDKQDNELEYFHKYDITPKYNYTDDELADCLQWANDKDWKVDKGDKTTDWKEEYKEDPKRQTCPFIIQDKMLRNMSESCLLSDRESNAICKSKWEQEKQTYFDINPSTGVEQLRYEYKRPYFAQWDQPKGQPCDIRDIVLIRDSETPVTFTGSACSVLSGNWIVNQYPSDHLSTLTNAKEVQVDHHVPLKNAWETGAYKWKPWQLKSYGNDLTPGHLYPIDQPSNGSKGERDVSEWLPAYVPNKCQYISDWLAVKYRYGLFLTKKEEDTIAKYITKCNTIPSYKVDKVGNSLKNIQLNPNIYEYPVPSKQDIEMVNDLKQEFCTNNQADITEEDVEDTIKALPSLIKKIKTKPNDKPDSADVNFRDQVCGSTRTIGILDNYLNKPEVKNYNNIILEPNLDL